jgi:hypothetical protein
MTQKQPKLCIDCKYYQRIIKLPDDFHGCRYSFDKEQERLSPIDYVTGEPRKIPEPTFDDAREMRNSSFLWCGPKADWFEPK